MDTKNELFLQKYQEFLLEEMNTHSFKDYGNIIELAICEYEYEQNVNTKIKTNSLHVFESFHKTLEFLEERDALWVITNKIPDCMERFNIITAYIYKNYGFDYRFEVNKNKKNIEVDKKKKNKK